MDEPRHKELKVDGEMIYQRERSDPGDRYFLEFWIGLGPGGSFLDPIQMTVGYPGERLSCILGRRLSLNWSR